MRKDAKTRVRTRIRARLDELGMTGRELARAVRHDAVNEREVDAWISGIIHGRQSLSLKYLDAVAHKLGVSPSELVRHDDAELRELTPSEMRLLHHYRTWPQGIRDAWLDMLEHFAASIPDRDTAAILDKLRRTPRSLRRPVLAWLSGLLESGALPEIAIAGDVQDSDVGAAATGTTRPARKGGRSPGSRLLHAADPKTTKEP